MADVFDSQARGLRTPTQAPASPIRPSRSQSSPPTSSRHERVQAPQRMTLTQLAGARSPTLRSYTAQTSYAQPLQEHQCLAETQQELQGMSILLHRCHADQPSQSLPIPAWAKARSCPKAQERPGSTSAPRTSSRRATRSMQPLVRTSINMSCTTARTKHSIAAVSTRSTRPTTTLARASFQLQPKISSVM